MRMRGTIRKIADETGLNQATVRRALQAADMTEAEASTDFDKAVATVSAIADSDRVIGNAANGRGEGGNRTNTAYADAKARREEMQIRKLEIENAKAEGRLIDREAVTQTGVRIIAEVRTSLLSLGYRLAEKVANKSDVREIARIVESEVRDVLGALANEANFFTALEADALS